ncbi:MAG: beta-lactamase family protein [Odoribacteraceae bacterium]|jgi:CubicO group peptidase (beta-lactamase class C family)|nr:beta-lactamase family protein [Odoribacteraceae bacterium]
MNYFKRMKKGGKIAAGVLLLLAGGYLCLPDYARRALRHGRPGIDDLSLFEHHVVPRSDSCREWPVAKRYNTGTLSGEDEAYLDRLGTVAFLVIREDSILYEEYRDGWSADKTSNLFSATKTLVGLLVGVALDEGKIKSLDEPVGSYLPEFNVGRKARITIRHLLTMSSGLSWDEAYSSLFSATTCGYYGRDLRALVMGLEAIEAPGTRFTYRSGDTQLLAFVVERATGMSLSDYAGEKLWRPMRACRDAYWLLDRAGGDEKAFCCFHSGAREIARVGSLLLREGKWEGRQLVPAAYMKEAISPAAYLKEPSGKEALDYYGFQTWIMHYRGMVNPYLRGMLGQYVVAVPSRDAIIVRLGRAREEVYEREVTRDLYRYMDIALRLLDHR